MSQIIIKYKLGSKVFLEKKIPYAFYFNQDDTSLKSESFPDNFILGNFTNALLWKQVLSTPAHFDGFEQIVPLSRIKISTEMLHEVQKNHVRKIDLNEDQDCGIRKYGYQNIFKYLLDIDCIDLASLTQSLKLSPFSIIESDVNNELLILDKDLETLSKAYQSMWEGQMEYFNVSPFRFLPKALLMDKLELFEGFIYENSAYNSHLIYLPKIQASFIFCGDLSFIEVWFLVVQTLSEIECFDNAEYLNSLMQSICPYPWAGVEVISGD
jgi:hypothetical protein